MTTVAVFDVGKSNLKLSAVAADGRLIETLSVENRSHAGPPYRHHDLGAVETWLLDGLATLGARHALSAIVPCAHGSGGVLVDHDGPVMPMIDYEQSAPAAVDDAYRRIAGSFRERGSAIMLGAAHLARQMLWLETEFPDAFARARWFLATPQYWAWRLGGAAAGEVTSLAAQSHLWCPAERRPAALVAARGWGRLMPPLRPAWDTLGTLRPEFAGRTGLSRETRILTGIHDSSANLYRYQAAGFADMAMVSTGTWMVAISDRAGEDAMTEGPGVCCNADVEGRPLAGVLTQAGREFAAVAGSDSGAATRESLVHLVESGTMALPSFGQDDGLFPGSAGRGRLEGPLAGAEHLRRSLAVLYTALLTDACLDGLGDARTLVLDGSFVREPLYGALLAALRPQARVLVNLDQYGTATGAALLAGHTSRTRPAPLATEAPPALSIPGLDAYRRAWRERAQKTTPETGDRRD